MGRTSPIISYVNFLVDYGLDPVKCFIYFLVIIYWNHYLIDYDADSTKNIFLSCAHLKTYKKSEIISILLTHMFF